jgi:Apea-like HEPN
MLTFRAAHELESLFTAHMNTEEQLHLANLLNEALKVAAKARSADFGLFFQLLQLRDRPSEAPIELRRILEFLTSLSSLEKFGHAYQYALGYRQTIDHRFLIGWLISRAQNTSSEQATADLARYLSEVNIDLVETLLVDGPQLNAPVDLGHGLQLVPWKELPQTDTKWNISCKNFMGHHLPTAGVTRRNSNCVIRHVRPWEVEQRQLPTSIEPLIDVFRCAVATCTAGFRLTNYCIEPPEWAPWAAHQSNFGVDGTVLGFSNVLTEEEVANITRCFNQFMKLDETQKVRLRTPIDRLNSSILAGTGFVDAAIELGIALESLFAPTKLSEGIGFAVRNRAARFMGSDLEARKSTVRLVANLYDLRSRAVHTGRFDADGSKRWTEHGKCYDTLKEGQSLVGSAIVKMIQDGEPRWEEFDLR